MSILDVFRQKERAETAPVIPQVSDVLLQALLGNEPITREKAMTIPAVSGAVDFISGTIAGMPVRLYKYRNGKVEPQENDARVRLLNGDTGDTLDAFQFRKAIVEDYLLGKGGYAYIERSGNTVTGLYYVEEKNVSVQKNYDPIHKSYTLNVWDTEYKPYEFIKLLRNTKDGASGTGLTAEVGTALETAYRTLLYQLGLVKSGGNKKGFLKSTRALDQNAINTLKQAWRNLYANDEENVVVLNNGLEFQEASNTSVEMQLNENKKTLVNEINGIFHISDDFYVTFKKAVYPIVRAFETALNRDLLLEREKKNLYFEFDVKEVLRANINERYGAYKLAKETGFMTLNEIRRAENLDYIEGLDVINVGLAAVLYDTVSHKYYTPNTDTESAIGVDDNDAGKGKTLTSGQTDDTIESRGNDIHEKDGKFGRKPKYAPSPQRNPNPPVQLGKKRYARLCGIFGTRFPYAKAGDICHIIDSSYRYKVKADGYGGFETIEIKKIK